MGWKWLTDTIISSNAKLHSAIQKFFFKKEKRFFFFLCQSQSLQMFLKTEIMRSGWDSSACGRITTFVDMSYMYVLGMYLHICFWLLHILPVREVWKSWGNSSKRTDNSWAALQEMMGTLVSSSNKSHLMAPRQNS